MNNNKLKAFVQINSLSQIISLNVDTFDIKLVAKSQVKDFDDGNNNIDLIATLFIFKLEKNKINKKKDQRSKQINKSIISTYFI